MPGGHHLLPADSRLWTDHDAHHAHRLLAAVDAMPGRRNPVPDHRRYLWTDHDPEHTHRVSGGNDDRDIVPGRPNELPGGPNDLPGGNRLRRDDLSDRFHPMPEHPVHGLPGGLHPVHRNHDDLSEARHPMHR